MPDRRVVTTYVLLCRACKANVRLDVAGAATEPVPREFACPNPSCSAPITTWVPGAEPPGASLYGPGAFIGLRLADVRTRSGPGETTLYPVAFHYKGGTVSAAPSWIDEPLPETIERIMDGELRGFCLDFSTADLVWYNEPEYLSRKLRDELSRRWDRELSRPAEATDAN